MTSISTYFSGGRLDRNSHLRTSETALRDIMSHPGSRFLPVQNGEVLTNNQGPVLLEIRYCEELTVCSENVTLLGVAEGSGIFSVNCDDIDKVSIPDDSGFMQGRDLISQMSPDDAHLLAYARAMNNWQNNHRYCGRCGSPTTLQSAGFVMECQNRTCGHRSFPRLDPAIIVLVENNERCLLGRQQNWPEQRFSTIAGFAEPGESLEDTLKREVKEETNIDVGKSRYLGSQPWPFPSALMIGFHAQAASTDITLNDGELAEAKWVSREQLRSGEIVLPPRTSIAFQLIAAWHDADSDTPLADLPQSEAFNAPRA